MQIEIADQSAQLTGEENAILAAVASALRANGARVSPDAGEAAPDILIVSHPLSPDATYRPEARMEEVEKVAAAMVSRGRGRIVHLVSAAGMVPMRRHPAWSAAMASVIAGVRALAMTSGPAVLVNAVAVGRVDEAGDEAMLSHVPLGQAGRAEDVANAVLFLVDPLNSYTTGQALAVDGGWTTGYGRNF